MLQNPGRQKIHGKIIEKIQQTLEEEENLGASVTRGK